MNFPGPINSNLSSASAISLDSEHLDLIPRSHSDAGGHDAGVIVVPDTQLLFSGDYARDGNDLILSAPNQKYVVHDYFRGEKRPTLASKDGATLTGDIVSALTGYVQYAQAAAPAAAEVIGHVMKMTGSASVVRNGVSIVLNIGDAVQKGDVVQTGTDSSIGLTLIDGTAFAMASNARMVLNEMVYDPNGSSNSSLISLVQGTITFVAGQTAKNGNMRVDTPVATMGIRGTAVLVEIAADNGPTKFSVLLEPDGYTGFFNIYDKITGQLIGTVTQAGQVTFVSPNGLNQVTSVEQAKTAFDLQTEKSIIQDVFKLYFPNYNPDANPKSTDHPRTDIGVPQNSLTKTGFSDTGRPTVTTTTTYLDPITNTTTTVTAIAVNTAPTFSVTNVVDLQAPALNPTPGPHSFYLGNQVTIKDPDIGAAPFLDVATPYLANTGSFTAQSSISSSITSITPVTFGAYLLDPLRIKLDVGTGLVTYDPDAFRFLDAGQTATYTFSFTAASGVGSSQSDKGSLTLTLTVTGANDAPTIEGTLGFTGGVKEDTSVTAANKISTDGIVTFKDFDLTDAHHASSVSNASGYIGAFSITQPSEDLHDTGNTGTVSWHFEIPNESANTTLQSLAEGQTLTQQYTITITDSHGASVDQLVTVTITGTNDAPVLAVDTLTSHPTFEKPATTGATSTIVDTANGTLSFTDVDLTDTHTVSAVLNTSSVLWSGHSGADLSSLSALLQNSLVAAIATADDSTNTGAGTVRWNFSAEDHLFDFLAATETLTLVYDVKVQDYYHDANGNAVQTNTSSTQQVTIVINAANDVPKVGSVAETDVDEQTNTAALSLAITSNFTDADLDDTGHTAAVQKVVASGVLPPGVTGNFDLSTGTLFGLLAPGTVTKLVGSTTGTAVFNFTAASTVFDYLAAGEQLTLVYTVGVSDAVSTGTQTITVVVTGTNDAPVIDAIAAVPLNEQTDANPLMKTIGVTFNDVDLTNTGHTAAITNVVTGGVTTGLALTPTALEALITPETVVKASGSSSGSVNLDFSAPSTAFDYLAAGEQLTLTYTVAIDDHAGGVTPQTFVVTITGTNDAPVIAAIAAVQLDEQTDTSALTTTIAATFTDVDLTNTGHTAAITNVVTGGVTTGLALTPTALEALITPETVVKASGSSSGSVNLDFSAPSTAFDYLAAGEQLTLTYTVAIDDHDGGVTPQTFVVTITGTNDAPVIAAIAAVPLDEQTDTSALTTTIAATFTDVDLTNTGHTAAITNVVTGGVTTGLALTPTALEALITPETVVKASGSSSGSVNLDFSAASSAFDYLAAGEQLTLTYTVAINDHAGGTTSQNFTVTVTGTNDAPVITADVSGVNASGAATNNNIHGLSETDAGLQTTGTLAVTDVDLTNTVAASVLSLSVVGYQGSLSAATLKSMLTLTDTGNVIGSTSTTGTIHWTFDSNGEAFNYLAKDETLELHYIIRATDTNTTVPSDTTHAIGDTEVVIKIAGTNDAPAVSGAVVDLLAVEDGPTRTLNALANATDVDDGSVISIANVPALPAGVTYDAIAHQFTLDPSNAAYQHLAAGDTTVVTVNYGVSDGIVTTPTPASVSWTITGTNDAPILVAGLPSATLVQPDHHTIVGVSSSVVTLTTADGDDGDVVSFDTTGWTSVSATVYEMQGKYGAADIDTVANTLTYHLNNDLAATRALIAGQAVMDNFNIVVNDTHHASATQPVSFTIDGSVTPLHVGSGSGEYHTIQDAINASADGDTIMVDAGTYSENLNINKAVTILGAHAGQSGTDISRDAANGIGETTIIGHEKITATTGSVLIDGVRFLNDGTTTHGGPSNPTLQIVSGEDHTVTDSIFYSSVAGGANGVADRAISLPTLSGGHITISDNYVTGSQTGLFGTASWGSALWSDGGENLSVTGNTFEFGRTALNLSLPGSSQALVDQNTFHSDGSGLSVGPTDNNSLAVTNNVFNNVDTDFNFQNLSSAVTFDASKAVASVVPANAATDPVVILGGAGNDTLTGTNGADVFTGKAGADNFVFNVGNGQDTITDFQQGQDKIDLHLISSFNAAALTALLTPTSGQETVGADVLLHLNGTTDTILVKNIAALTASDFIIHA